MSVSFTAKQRAFIDYYLLTLNATEAAKLAKYNAVDDNSFASIGSENLRKPKIREEIDRRLEALTISANETLARVSRQATGTMADFLQVTTWGTRLDLTKAEAAGALDLIKKYKETERTWIDKDGEEHSSVRREIELYPSDSALDKLMRHHGLYKDHVDVNSSGEIVITVKHDR